MFGVTIIRFHHASRSGKRSNIVMQGLISVTSPNGKDAVMSVKTRPFALRRLPWPRLIPDLAGFLALRRSRRHLARLDDHILRDIGLSRAEAEAEAIRPLWDAPPHWRRPNA
jgi:uncharacterized protein YjiS (DUF1127 family)